MGTSLDAGQVDRRHSYRVAGQEARNRTDQQEEEKTRFAFKAPGRPFTRFFEQEGSKYPTHPQKPQEGPFLCVLEAFLKDSEQVFDFWDRTDAISCLIFKHVQCPVFGHRQKTSMSFVVFVVSDISLSRVSDFRAYRRNYDFFRLPK